MRSKVERARALGVRLSHNLRRRPSALIEKRRPLACAPSSQKKLRNVAAVATVVAAAVAIKSDVESRARTSRSTALFQGRRSIAKLNVDDDEKTRHLWLTMMIKTQRAVMNGYSSSSELNCPTAVRVKNKPIIAHNLQDDAKKTKNELRTVGAFGADRPSSRASLERQAACGRRTI